MDTSRRAIEAYRRSLAVDELTSDDANLAPVYKLDEFSDLFRTSDVSMVNDLSLYVLKRLQHKSPLVKQKALRLIKYGAAGKFGAEFKREMQRNSAPMRELFHYKGQQDPLRGDALNKAVRDTAHEAVSCVFATDNSRAAGGYNNRIEGFGSTDLGMPWKEKKSFLSETAGLGIKRATNSSDESNTIPTLRRSLTTEVDRHGRGGDGHQTAESLAASVVSKNMASRIWSSELVSEDNGSSYTGIKTHEERLLETIVTSGGVRLHPTRDALQALLAEASKLDAVAMSRAIEIKLHSHSWQKFGVEFKREMQWNLAPIRELFHYKGQQDPLRGDTLNKVVYDDAHEAVSSVFATDNSRATTAAGGYNNRIEGFCSTNLGMPSKEYMSFFIQTVGLRSASIKRATNSDRKPHDESNKFQTLRRFLIAEVDRHGYGGDNHQTKSLAALAVSKNTAFRIWSYELVSEDNGSIYTGDKSHEERLFETILAFGGVRLQPTHDALQALLVEASKLDAMAMSWVIEIKLHSHSWQARYFKF